MPRFGKDKDARKEELDRQAAEEVERLTRRGGPAGMGGGMVGPGGAPRIGIPSPLEQIADELRDAPPPSMRRIPSARRTAPQQPQQAFTPMPSGAVGSSFGPGGLNPGPRMGVTAPPPSAFGGTGYDEDYGGPVTGPPVYYAEPDEEEEMTITELALMDHAARTGHNPEDLVMQYDATSAEDMRDRAMRQFYERQQSRSAGPQTNNPFAPAGMRRGAGGPAAPRVDNPAAAGGALAQRLANRRRRDEEEARRSGLPAPAARDTSATGALARNKPKVAANPAAGAAAPEPAEDDGALAKLLARRRQSLGLDAQDERAPATGSRHAAQRAAASPGMRAAPSEPELDEREEEAAAPAPARKAAARKASAGKASPAAKTAAPATKKAPAATKAPAKKAAPATTKAGKAGATLAEAPAPTAKKKAVTQKAAAQKAGPAAKKAAKAGAKSVFCMECGEKNPVIAKFCFNCGNRLAVPED